MKKIFYVLPLIFCIVLLSGCGKNEVNCSGNFKEEDVEYSMNIVAEFDKDDVVKIATVSMTFDDQSTADSYCNLLKTIGSDIATCDGKKVSFDYATILADDKESFKTTTKKEFIDLMEGEDSGLTCK